MAISAPHYHCLKELHRRGELPQGGALLEIGEANWYGDLSPQVVLDEWRAAGSPAMCSWSEGSDWDSFNVVKAVYATLFRAADVLSLDKHGTPKAQPAQLNDPVYLLKKYSTVINHGTLEHIFNPAQVLKTMHDHCAVGGLLIHESPFAGWIDHGFWTIQPTLYFDLAAANQYQMVFMAVNQIELGLSVEVKSREQLLQLAAHGNVPNNSMLYVAMRKAVDAEFKIPMQGYYAETISDEASKAWKELR